MSQIGMGAILFQLIEENDKASGSKCSPPLEGG